MTTLTAHEIDDEMNILLSEAKRIKDRDYDRQLSRADSGSSLNRAFIGDSSELKMVNGSSQFSMISISEIGPVPQDNILYDIESPDQLEAGMSQIQPINPQISSDLVRKKISESQSEDEEKPKACTKRCLVERLGKLTLKQKKCRQNNIYSPFKNDSQTMLIAQLLDNLENGGSPKRTRRDFEIDG